MSNVSKFTIQYNLQNKKKKLNIKSYNIFLVKSET